MNNKYAAFADKNIGGRPLLEDEAEVRYIETKSGLKLQIGIVCDGVGGSGAGEVASNLAIRTILQSIENNTGRNVPQILRTAILEANDAINYRNRAVEARFENEKNQEERSGSTTTVLYAIDTDDGEWGRLFVASVGDSCVYLMRAADEDDGEYQKNEMRLIRLNSDHTKANDMVMRGEIKPEDAHKVDGGNKLTRALGRWEEIVVDTGIYAIKGHSFVTRSMAEKLGEIGLALKEADTIFASSDGFFDYNVVTENTFITEEEFKRHALDKNAESVARTLIAYAARYEPSDNISIALTFVSPDSPLRKTVSLGTTGLSPVQRLGLISFVVVVLFTLVIGGIILSQVGGENQELMALQAETATKFFSQTQVALDGTATASQYTATPSPTPTETSTVTPSPSPTTTPTELPVRQFEDEVARLYDNTGFLQAFRQENDIFADTVSHLVISGVDESIRGNGEGAILMYPSSQVNFARVLNNPYFEIEMSIQADSDIFFYPAGYRAGGVNIEITDDLELSSNSVCMILDYRQASEIVITCTDTTNASICSYKFNGSSGEESSELAMNSRTVLNTETGIMISSASVREDAITLDLERYYTDVYELLGSNIARCLSSIVDRDSDSFVHSQDACPDEAGIGGYLGSYEDSNGCADDDGDGVPNNADACQGIRGTRFNRGCTYEPNDTPTLQATATRIPTSTATTTNGSSSSSNNSNGDNDKDGVLNGVDRCPNVSGPSSNHGCPYP